MLYLLIPVRFNSSLFIEWPRPETVAVGVVGLHKIGNPRNSEHLSAGWFTFTSVVTKERPGHGSQCPASSSSEEILRQMLRLVGCNCMPSRTSHGGKHNTTGALKKVAKDCPLSSGEQGTVAMQIHLGRKNSIAHIRD